MQEWFSSPGEVYLFSLSEVSGDRLEGLPLHVGALLVEIQPWAHRTVQVAVQGWFDLEKSELSSRFKEAWL
jgi:hypothetical protein